MANNYINLPIPEGGPPSGAAGGDLAGDYPNPTVPAVDSATALATGSTLVKRSTNGNAQFAALTMAHVSAGVDNVGMGGAASIDAGFPLLIQRDLATPIVFQMSNPDTGAGSGGKFQLASSNGTSFAEMGLLSPATASPDAYSGGPLTIRSSGTTPSISIIADDNPFAVINFYAAGNAATNKALTISFNKVTTSFGGIQILTAGSRPTANAGNRGLMFVVLGGTGVTDTLEVCLKSAGDTYSWVTVVTGG